MVWMRLPEAQLTHVPFTGLSPKKALTLLAFLFPLTFSRAHYLVHHNFGTQLEQKQYQRSKLCLACTPKLCGPLGTWRAGNSTIITLFVCFATRNTAFRTCIK